MNKLSKENIDHLFSFVKSKYVRYYDVQLELVDHLASSIEDEMISDPGLTFDQGLSKVYDRFPITGFNDFIQEKTKALNWFWAYKFWEFTKQYFRLPKIILTIGLTVILYFLSQQVVNIGSFSNNGLSIALIVIILAQWISFLKLPKVLRTNDINDQLLSILTFKGILGGFLYVPYFMFVQGFAFRDNVLWAATIEGKIAAIILSLVGVATIILTDAIRTEGLDWIHEELHVKYPELGLMKK